MKFDELSPQAMAKIQAYRYDSFFEKHEGPWDWKSTLRFTNSEFLEVSGYPVLLPVDRDRLAHLEVLRCIVGDQSQALTIFLKDPSQVDDPSLERFLAGRLGICEKVPGEEFFIAIVYHEWFITFESS